MWVKKWAADRVREELGIFGCRTLIRLDKEVRRRGERLSLETRYFISSLDPNDVKPSDFQKWIRDHWQVETSLHFVKDRWWDEDKHYLKHAGNIFVKLTNAALSVLRLLQIPGEPLTQTAEDFHYSPRKALQTLGFNKN